MIDSNTAQRLYSEIKENHSEGNAKQRVLGNRATFDTLLQEVFQLDKSSAFYVEGLDRIFREKGPNGFKEKNFRKMSHRLRKMYNDVQHSVLSPGEIEYLFSVRMLSNLIWYCSHVEIPTEIKSIFDKDVVLVENNETIVNEVTKTSEEEQSFVRSQIITSVVFIIDCTLIKDAAVLACIQQNISLRFGSICQKLQNAYICSIRNGSTKLTNIKEERVYKFEFDPASSRIEHYKPLTQLIKNKQLGTIGTMLLVTMAAFNDVIPRVDELLGFEADELSSYCMSIGVCSSPILTDVNPKRFDKLVTYEKIPDFFEWLQEVIAINR